MNIGERMKLRRKQLKLSADLVAEKLGVSRSTVFRYEKGDIEKLPTNFLDDIAEILQTTPAYLMGWDSEEVASIETIYNQLEEKRKAKVYDFAEYQLKEQSSKVVPLFGKTAANPTELTYGDINYDEVVETNVPSSADCALVVQGDSMEPEYTHGQIVFYKSQPSLENGEMAIVEINGDGVTLKKVYFNYDTDKIILRSLNNKYDDRELNPEDVRILGKVVK